MNGLKASLVLLPVLYHTNTTSVPPSSDHNDIAHVKLDEINDLICLQINLDCVICLNKRIRIADGAPIMCSDTECPSDQTGQNGPCKA
jgi:hypothetical protein